MKSIFIKLIILPSFIIFTGCSNISAGFEEGSIFYTSPSEKKSEQKEVVKKEVTHKTITVKEVEEEPIKKDAEVELKEDVENETTISYSSDDGE